MRYFLARPMTCSLERVCVVMGVGGWMLVVGKPGAGCGSPGDFGARDRVAEEHVQKREPDAAVEDEGGFRARLERLEAGLDLGHHAAVDDPRGDQLPA